ncbi:MAG: hypothetical protein JKX73_08680 [Flavobacteriales bacterium]|nr:hypothetical protein [Flavobacteriales bacterium]
MKKLKFLLTLSISFTFYISSAQNNPPVAVDDFYSTTSGNGGINPVQFNDSDPDGDSTFIDTAIFDPDHSVNSFVLGGYLIKYAANKLFYGVDTVYYVLCDNGIPSMCDTGRLIVDVTYLLWEHNELLDVNNVSARFNANGSDFWDHESQSASFELPKGSGKHTIFTSNLWIAGKDAQDSLHIAATRYLSNGQDIYTGPIMDTSEYSFSQDSL